MSVFSGERVGGGGGGRLGWRCAVVDTGRLRVVFRGNGTGLSSMGGGRRGAPGKSTLRLCDSSRAMIVLALAEVNFSFVQGVARGVEEAEWSSSRLFGENVLKSCGMLFGEQGGESG